MPRNTNKKAAGARQKASGHKPHSAAPRKASKRATATAIKAPKPKATKKSSKTTGVNRVEGIRQYVLAGRPTKEQFQIVFGQRGHLMTWSERAEAAGLKSPEEAAKAFQKMLAGKEGR